MTELLKLLNRFDITLTQTVPTIANRLQSGLTPAEIEAQVASFTWTLPQDAFLLYQWHNGLSGKPGKFNLGEKLLRLKGKWHGELTGRENEIHTKLGNRLIITKFLPLEYSLAGHRHLKLGRCQIDLLPLFILMEDKKTIYCMMRLDPDNPTIYCANGTKLPPMKVTESFLSTQPQFRRLSDFIEFLTRVCQPGIQQETAGHNQELLISEAKVSEIRQFLG
ncbi:MAG: hypothetical protein RLZZ04_4255 [Cyanobacteriota bacterium]